MITAQACSVALRQLSFFLAEYDTCPSTTNVPRTIVTPTAIIASRVADNDATLHTCNMSKWIKASKPLLQGHFQ